MDDERTDRHFRSGKCSWESSNRAWFPVVPGGTCLRRAAFASGEAEAAGSELAADRIRVRSTRGKVGREVPAGTYYDHQVLVDFCNKETSYLVERGNWPGLGGPRLMFLKAAKGLAAFRMFGRKGTNQTSIFFFEKCSDAEEVWNTSASQHHCRALFSK